MSAKSLGTLPVIYAVDGQQNPLPRKTMLFDGDTTSNGGRNDVVNLSLLFTAGSAENTQHCYF